MFFSSSFSADLSEALQGQSWDNAIFYLEKSPQNRQAMMSWILDTFAAIQFLRANLNLSFRILRVISAHGAPQDFFRLENIYKLFRTRVISHQENAHQYDGIQQEIWQSQNQKMKEWAARDKAAFVAYMNSKDEGDWTPLHWAASDGNIGLFKIVKEIDPGLLKTLLQKRDKLNMTPLYLAYSQHQQSILEYFSRHEKAIFEDFLEEPIGPGKTIALIDAIANDDRTFCELVGLKHPEMFVRLIQIKDANGMTLMHWAAYKGRQDVTDLICQIEPGLFRKFLSVRDAENFTPLHGAFLGINYPFIRKIAQKYPVIFEQFMKAPETEIMQKILDSTNDDNMSLLSQMTSSDQVELLEILNKKNHAVFIQYVRKEEAHYQNPFKNAIEYQRPRVLEYFFLAYPELFKETMTVEYLNNLCADMPSKGALLRRFCSDPVTAGILHSLLSLYEGHLQETIDEIQANLRRPHARDFIKALLRSEKILKFLNKRDDILTAWFEQNPARDFLTHEQQLDLLLQLPPSQIYKTIEDLTVEKCDAMMRSRIFVEGEHFQIKEVLNLAYAQFGEHLDEESAATCCQEYINLIKPKFLAAALETDESNDIILTFLPIFPDPLFRVVIPLLNGNQFIEFIENVHFVNQVSYLGVATCQQKIDYLEELKSQVTDDIKTGMREVRAMCQNLNARLQEPAASRDAVLPLYAQLKDAWSRGHGNFVTMTQNLAILHQLQNKMQACEICDVLQAMIASNLVPVIQETREACAEMERLRAGIFGELSRHPLLAEVEAPDEFYCPISGTIMTDPVVDKYGNTFERASITEWIQSRGTSPINRQPLTLEDLKPNEVLKARILAFSGSQAPN